VPVKQVGVELGWGPAKLSGTWEPDQTERDAAWELYVELVTRIAVFPLSGEGILREALTSLYQLFAATREILRKYGPAIARKPKAGQYRFGYLAIWLLNAVLRPVLTKWHPELQRWEASRPADRSIAEHEQAWSRNEELRTVLDQLRDVLLRYAELLATVCDAPALIDATHEIRAASAKSSTHDSNEN
jgi:hypothetical protein